MKRCLFFIIFLLSLSLIGKEVFFVPGWRTGYSGRDGCIRIMRDIWPGTPIIAKPWKSLGLFSEVKENAREYTVALLAEIRAMPAARRRELILVGHSIGASIVVEVLTNLAKDGSQIREVVLLGAALPNDDPRLWDVLKAVRQRCYSVAFAGDGVLKLLYPFSENNTPLGISGWRYSHPRFVETRVDNSFSFFNHFAYLYLEALENFYDTHPPYPSVVSVKNGCAPYSSDEDKIYWTVVEFCGSWELQKHRLHNIYRIADPGKMVRAAGDEKTVRDIFADIKSQLSVPRGAK